MDFNRKSKPPMNIVAQLFRYFSPRFFAYLCRIKEERAEIPPFLFHGSLHSGKEWMAIKSIQLLNCPQFLENDHHPLFCKICSQINILQTSNGVLPFFSALQLEQMQPILLKEIFDLNPSTDPLQKEAIIHEIAKLELFLEAQLVKEKEGGGSKKLGLAKAQSYGEQLSELRHSILEGHVDSKKKKGFETLLSEASLFQTDMGLDFLKHLIKKLQVAPLSPSSYRVLLVKDPALLKYQSLIMNVLLKTIEDPRVRFTAFFVTYKKTHILRTIRSRCNFLAFSPLSTDYKSYVSKELPNYHFIFPPHAEFSIPSVAEIQKAPLSLQKPLVLEYLEYRKAFYTGVSPLLKQKRQEIENLIIGLREYNLPLKNILDILPTL